MAQNNDTIKCLAAMLVVGGGFLIAHATLGYYRETEFGVVVAGGLGLLLGFLAATLVLAGIVWGVAFGVIGGQNRGTFQVIWVYMSCFLLLLYALGTSSDLHKMGVLFGEFRDRDVVKGLDLLKWIVLFAPYAAIFTALSILHSQEESEAARAQRLQNLSYAEMQVTMLPSMPIILKLVQGRFLLRNQRLDI